MKEDFVMIQALVKRGVYQRDIATLLGGHPKTVGRALAHEGAPAGPGKRGSLLDSYKERIDGLLQEGVWNAVVIWRELQAGGVSRRGLDHPGLHPPETPAADRPGDGAVRDRPEGAAAERLGDALDPAGRGGHAGTLR